MLELFEAGQAIDFPTVVTSLVARKANVKVFMSECLWLDIGRPSDYASATETFIEPWTNSFQNNRRQPKAFRRAAPYSNGRHS